MRKLAILALMMTLGVVAHADPPTMVAPTGNDFVLWTGAATDTCAVGMADYTGYLMTGKFQRLYLYLKLDKPASVAIQVRSHGKADTNFVTLQDSTDTFVWPFSPFVNAGTTAGADTNSWTDTPIPNRVQHSKSEAVFRMTQSLTGNNAWPSPRGGIVIPLRRRDGEWYWGKVTTIRVRVLASSHTPVVLTGSLRGVPWGGSD
jgi:hypothetical protein